MPYGAVFDVHIQPLNAVNGNPLEPDDSAWIFLNRFYIRGKSEKNKLYSIQFDNLPFGRWYFRFTPKIVLGDSPKNASIIRLDNNNAAQTSNTTVNLAPYNTPVEIICERRGGGTSKSSINDTIRENYDKRTASSERGAPVKIISVSEGIDPEVVNADITYEGIAMAGVRVRASDRINSDPDLSLFIAEGREIRTHLAFGVSESSGVLMEDTSNDFLLNPDINAGASIVRNLETGTQGIITGINNNSLVSDVEFSEGDRYLVFNIQSSSYFPDIYVDILINPRGGLGGIIDGDEYIDYESIVEAVAFCKENRFFWDGVMSAEEEFSSWASAEGALSRLIPLRIEGRYGLIIEEKDIPLKAVFNESNILKDSFAEENVPWQENDINQVVLTITNGNDLQRPVTAVTARTQGLVTGLEKLNTFNVEATSITDIEQAKNIAAIFLKQKRLQNKAVKFRTALQGVYLRPGDLIMVQHQITEFDFEVSGYVTAVGAYDETNLTQKFSISRQFPAPGAESEYRATIQLQSTGEIVESVEFSSVIEFGQPFIELEAGSLPATLSIGDPVLVGKVVNFNRKYRIQSLSRGEDGTVEITSLIWTEDIFDDSDLVIITE